MSDVESRESMQESADKRRIAELEGQVRDLESLLSVRAVRDAQAGCVVVPQFDRLTSAGQLKKGDQMILVTSMKRSIKLAKVKKILFTDGGGEEILFDKKKNHYFITSMVIDGSSWVKEVYIFKAQEGNSP